MAVVCYKPTKPYYLLLLLKTPSTVPMFVFFSIILSTIVHDLVRAIHWVLISCPPMIAIYFLLSSQDPDACVPHFGPKAGSKCVFPFKYGKTCPGPKCCNLGNDPRGSWCSTRVDARGIHMGGHYAYCKGSSCAPEGKSFNYFTSWFLSDFIILRDVWCSALG